MTSKDEQEEERESIAIETLFGRRYSTRVSPSSNLSRRTISLLRRTVVGTLTVEPRSGRSGSVRKPTDVGTDCKIGVEVLSKTRS